MDSSFEEGEKVGIRKVALALKKQRVDVEIISTTTGLTPEEIEKL